MSAKVFLIAAELGALLLPIHYTVTPKGNYSDGFHAGICYISTAFYLFLCVWLILRNWKKIDPKRKFAIGTALVIVSGYDDFSYCREALRLQITDYILKPVNYDEFGSCIDDLKISLFEKRVSAVEKTEKRRNEPSSVSLKICRNIWQRI